MEIYLPITEMAVNFVHLILLGGGVGFLSALLGVSGGFLLTPMLILMGIPSAIAVATQSAGVIATSTTGVMGHWRQGNVDIKMAILLLIGGFAGSTLGVWLFTLLKGTGNLDITIKILYIVFLSVIGFLMMWELVRTTLRNRNYARHKLHQHTWLHKMPLRMRFPKSRLYISIFPPVIIGFVVGTLSALMGVGGGFILVPAMIYLLGMHTSVVVGTSLIQGIVVAINATFWQATMNNTVDIVLGLILIVGGVAGARIGSRLGGRLKGEQLRLILAVIVLSVAGKLLYDIIPMPMDLFTISIPRGHL